MRLPRHATAAIALAGLLLLAPPAPANGKEISACAAAAYRPAEQSPFGGLPTPSLEPVSVERVANVEIRTYSRGECHLQVSFFINDEETVRELVDAKTGTLLEVWTSHQVGAELARGYEGAVAQTVNSPWVWIPVCLLFLAPFIDFRRPFRLLHLDLLVLVGLSASLFFFNRAEIEASVALTYPVLAYVLLRALYAGFRPTERGGPLLTWAPVRWLAIAAVLLGAGRIALNVADSRVIDVC